MSESNELDIPETPETLHTKRADSYGIFPKKYGMTGYKTVFDGFWPFNHLSTPYVKSILDVAVHVTGFPTWSVWGVVLFLQLL